MSNDSNERGQALIVFLLVFPLMMGAMGLAVDLGWSYFRQEAAKSAAQAAVLGATTAAGALSSGSPACGVSNVVCQSATQCPVSIPNPAVTNIDVACQYAKDNGFANSVGGVQNVMVAAGTGTPTGLSGITAPYWVQVTAAESIPQTFSAVFGSHLGGASARATSGYLQPTGGCLYVLGSPSTTLSMVGNANITMGCGIYVNSTSASAVDLKGNSGITVTGGASVNITGGWSHTGNASISPSPNTGTSPVADPLSALTPPVSSGCSTTTSGGTQTISPCVAGGIVTLTNGISLTSQSSLTLNPGVYIVDGGISMAGQATLNASGGVTLYVPNGSISMAGGATVNLTAPTSGPYKGVGIYQPASNTSSVTMTGGSTQLINGAIYAPGASVSFAGNSGGGGSTIVCDSISFVGNSSIGKPAATAYSGSTGPTLIE